MADFALIKEPSVEVNHSFTVDSDRDRVWRTLWDIDAVAKCIPGCERVTVIAPQRSYLAHVRKKVGPFALGIELEVNVLEHRAPDLLRVEIKGEDKRLRSRVTQAIAISLTPEGDRATRINITGEFQLEGLMGTLNKHLISGQVEQTLEEFSQALRTTIMLGSKESARDESEKQASMMRPN